MQRMMRNFKSLVVVLLASLQLAKACTDPLGMESGAIEDSQISIGDNIGKSDKEKKLRYNDPDGWCTNSYPMGVGFNEKGYIQIDLKADHTVSAILLRRGGGRQKAYSYGKTIKIQWRDHKTSAFGFYKGKDGQELKLNETGLEERINFNKSLCARYLRILPYLNENHVCFRLEILGCSSCSGSPATGVAPTSTTQKKTTVTTAKAASARPSLHPSSHAATDTKKDTTNGILPSPKPGKRSSKPTTILIVAIVVSLCFCVVIVICLYRFRRRLKCLSKGRDAAKHKNPKKKKFAVKMEAMYSDVNTNDELEKLAIEETQATDEMETNTYSEVYAAPLISRPKQGKMATEDSLYANDKLNQASNYLEPDVDNAKEPKEHYYSKEPIYAGSQIYDNPYQAVTASSIYADPTTMNHNGTLRLPEFPRNALRFLEKIGEGQFGEVHICEVDNFHDHVENPSRFSIGGYGVTKVAVKLLKAGQDNSIREEFMKEARVMSRFEHENVVQLIGVCLDDPQCMVVEYMENGDLMQFLQVHRRYTGPPNPRLSLVSKDVLVNDVLFYISMQVAAGMRYLALQGFVHRDLASRNCLVGHAFTVKIADFGMSRNLYTKQYYRIEGKAILPIRWMAPESLYYGTFTTYTDVWSFGVTVWEIFSFAAEQPFDRLSDEQVIENALSLAERPGVSFQYLPKPQGCPDATYAMLMKCWKTVPEERPNFQKLFDFFKSLSPNSLEISI